MFHFDLQEHVFIKVQKVHAIHLYFYNCHKEMFPKSNMKSIAKYDVYLDILLVVSIYVIKSVFLLKAQKSEDLAD